MVITDYGILKVHRSALSVGYPAVVKDLEQDIQNVGMRLFYLVKQDDRIRLAADLLGELACLVVADIARRRTDNARYAEFFHKLGHIEPYKRLGRVETDRLQARFTSSVLPTPVRADKDKDLSACALALSPTRDALYCRAHGVYRLVLADDMRFQALIKLRKSARTHLRG